MTVRPSCLESGISGPTADAKSAPTNHKGLKLDACRIGLEGIVSKRLGSPYRSGRSPDWLKMKNPEAPAVKREAEEVWGRRGR
jgi:ATP-dependent DNA ligase